MRIAIRRGAAQIRIGVPLAAMLCCLLVQQPRLVHADEADADEIRVLPVTNVFFAGQEVHWRADVQGRDLLSWVEWSLAFEGKLIERGVSRLQAKRVDLVFQYPKLRNLSEKVQLQLSIRVWAVEPDRPRLFQFPIWFFPLHVFQGRQGWLEQQQVAVLDTTGEAIALMESSGLVARRVSELAQVDAAHTQVLMIGENVDLHPSVLASERIRELLCGGCDVVLFLPPKKGLEWALDTETCKGRLQGFQLGTDWSSFLKHIQSGLPQLLLDESVTRRRLAVVTDQVRLRFELAKHVAPWYWAEIRHVVAEKVGAELDDVGKGGDPGMQARRSSRLIVISLPLISHWTQSTVTQYLVLDVLQYLESQRNL